MAWLDLFYHELQCLVSPWSLKVLCIYVLQFQKGLARYHLVVSYYDCFEKVLSSEFYYYGSLADYIIDMSNCETYVLLWVWLVHNLCWKLECWLYIFKTTRANRVCKSFSLSLSVYQLNCLRTSKGLSWGRWYVSVVSTFPNTFALVLDSNLHDLNGTNSDWHCFQQNCHDVVLCAENKSSRNDLKFHRISYNK